MIVNILNLIFINFILDSTILYGLVILFESYLPVFIRQAVRYGKFSHKGSKNLLVSLTEVPKSWFKHFYVFALFYSWISLLLALRTIVFLVEPPNFVISFLDFIAGGKDRKVLVDSTSALIAIILIATQCFKRFYETHYVQIFSSHAKINLIIYIVGYIHYFGVCTAILANCEGFVQGSPLKEFNFSQVTFFQFLCISLFLYSCLHQYKSNLILVDLRKDNKGNVVTEKHLLPIGGYFVCVSSPHMLFEILMYIGILGIIPANITWRYITFWVISNQIGNAWLAHQWYKENFKDYPRNRKAILPLLF